MKNYFRYLSHVPVWIFLYLLPYLFSFPGLPDYKTIFSNPGDYIHLTSFTLLILFTYINYFIITPIFYFNRSYGLYAALIAACFWVTIYLPALLVPKNLFQNFSPPSHNEPMPFLFGRNYTIFLFIISVFSSIMVYTRGQLQKVETEKLNAELLFLKAQINPHFLFNTLNSIYALAINKDDKAPDAIVQLSELMRYIIKDAHQGMVPLEKEISYINNYISLQHSRLGNTAVINYFYEGKANGKEIVPLILISLIENAFKHGVNPNQKSEIKVSIHIKENILTLDVTNKKVETVTNNDNEAGIGLKNTKERLELVYPHKHTLAIDDSNNIFSVKLTINLI